MTAATRQMQVLDDENDDTLLRVAFATSDRRHVDQHFGSARSFAIYGVDQERSKIFKVAEFGEATQDGNEDKLVNRMALLDGCIAVYCRACGGSAVRQLLAIGVQPVKVPENAAIAELIQALQDELRSGPSSWLAKAIERQRPASSTRFDEMDAEGWQE